MSWQIKSKGARFIANGTPVTKLMYAKHLSYLFRSAGRIPIAGISRDEILSYLQSLRKPLPLDPNQR